MVRSQDNENSHRRTHALFNVSSRKSSEGFCLPLILYPLYRFPCTSSLFLSHHESLEASDAEGGALQGPVGFHCCRPRRFLDQSLLPEIVTFSGAPDRTSKHH